MIAIRRFFCPGHGLIRPEELKGFVFSPESNAHTFVITKLDGSNIVPFPDDSEVTARLIRADQETILIDGDLTDGTAAVNLPAECYQVPGRFTLHVFVETDAGVTCVYAAAGTVVQADSGRVSIPEGTAREIDDEIIEIRTAVSTVPDVIASIPQDYTALSDTVSSLERGSLGETNTAWLKHGRYISGSGKWASGTNYVYALIPIQGGDVIQIKAGSNVCIYAFLKSDYSGTSAVSFADGVSGRATVAAGGKTVTTAPATSVYLYVLVNNVSNRSQWLYWPEKLIINGENVSWPVRWLTEQNLELALSALHSVNGGNGAPYLRGFFSVSSEGTWIAGDYQYALLPVSAGDVVTITVRAGSYSCYYAFLEHDVIPGEVRVAFAGNETARRTVSPGAMASVTAPVGSVYLYVLYSIGSDLYYPQSISINGISMDGNVRQMNAGVFKYEAGTFLNGVATERLTVGFPSGTGYVGYVLYRYVYPDNHCNVWRVFSFNVFDHALNSTATLSAKGELECAVSLQGRPDFSGGSTHGDEMMTGFNVYADGREITSRLADCGNCMPFRELRLVRHSELFDPSAPSTKIADHGVEYIFSDGTMTINQALKWAVSESLSSCYMAMFTPGKAYTDHYYTDVDYAVTEYPGDNYGISVPGARHAVAYGSGGFCGEFWVEQYPEGLTGGDRMLITDNSGNSYNKMYYVICNAGQTTVGELWKTTTKYRVRFS